jgi:thiol-disulfide isomerase/thioredoxin
MAGESKPPKTIAENDQVFNGSGDNTAVFYYTDWCPSCKNIRPLWDQAKAEITDIKFVEVNTDTEESPDYVQTVPTIIFQGKRYNNTIDYDEFCQFLTSFPGISGNAENSGNVEEREGNVDE